MSQDLRKIQYQKVLKKSKFKTRIFNQCSECGRRRAFIRQFGKCRICVRNLARSGQLPGITKSTW